MGVRQFRVAGVGDIRSLTAAIASLLVTGLCLSAAAIESWAHRLPVKEGSSAREAFIHITTGWADTIRPSGLLAPRQAVMDWRVGSGDAAQGTTNLVAASAALAKPAAAKAADALQPPATGDLKAGAAAGPPAIEGAQVALVGDSIMAVGLGPNLARELRVAGARQSIRAYRSGAGLARPDYFNWMVEYPRLTAGAKPDLIICAIGANDAQGFQVGDKVYKFGQPAWIEAYLGRVESFLDMMQGQDITVYWLLMPRMRSPAFDNKMQMLNDLVLKRFSGRPRLHFIESDPILVESSGPRYLEYVTDAGGKLGRIRAEDGIHLTDLGGKRLAQGVVKAIQRPGLAGHVHSR
jgi:hypothetical protein